jgi:hypothetical protein
MTLFIEGLAFPLNQKNANGWGIPASEADNAIKTLQSSVIRICPRDGPHDCDFSEDPKSEVGRIVAAWREGDVGASPLHIILILCSYFSSSKV